MNLNIAFTTTDIVAWWGAIIATFVLAWDVYKWKTSGAKIRFSSSSGMKVFGDPEKENDTFITARLTNIGDRPTTITTVAFKYYDCWWAKFRNKVTKAFFIPDPALSYQTLPFVLEVGQEWMGGTKQSEDLEEMAKNGYLIIEVYDSVHVKPSSGRIIIS